MDEVNQIVKSDTAKHIHKGYLSDEALDRLEHLLDSQFRVPFIGFPIGLDGLIGLIPGIGDVITTGLSLAIVGEAWGRGVRKRTIGRMLFNTGLDFAIGLIPLVGDLFDIGFKANVKNIRLMRDDQRK